MCKQEFIPILTIINILFTKWDYNPLDQIRLYINFPVVMTGLRIIKINIEIQIRREAKAFHIQRNRT